MRTEITTVPGGNCDYQEFTVEEGLGINFDIRTYLQGDDLLDSVTHFLRPDARAWCEEFLCNFVEHKTGRPELPLVIYFVNEGDKAAFSKRWLQ